MYTNRLPRLDFQRQLMGRRDTGRPRRRWEEQDNSSFKGKVSRTYSLDTFVMVMKRENALDMLHGECHESAGFCFIGYQSNIVCLDLSSLRDLGNTRLYVTTENL